MITFRMEGRNASPEVVIDKQNQKIDISGSSTLKNTSWFYGNLLKWAIAFNRDEHKPTVINIHLKKINNSSAKWLFLIIKKMSDIIPVNNVMVNWYYDSNNTSMQLNGERLKLNSLVPVNIIAS